MVEVGKAAAVVAVMSRMPVAMVLVAVQMVEVVNGSMMVVVVATMVCDEDEMVVPMVGGNMAM